MALEIIGRITKFFPQESGQGKNGPWSKQVFTIETEGQYPKTVGFGDFNDKANAIGHRIGDMVKVSFDVESRVYNERVYTDLRAYRIEAHGDSPAPRQPVASQPARQPAPANTQMNPAFNASDFDEESNDLPF